MGFIRFPFPSYTLGDLESIPISNFKDEKIELTYFLCSLISLLQPDVPITRKRSMHTTSNSYPLTFNLMTWNNSCRNFSITYSNMGYLLNLQYCCVKSYQLPTVQNVYIDTVIVFMIRYVIMLYFLKKYWRNDCRRKLDSFIVFISKFCTWYS